MEHRFARHDYDRQALQPRFDQLQHPQEHILLPSDFQPSKTLRFVLEGGAYPGALEESWEGRRRRKCFDSLRFLKQGPKPLSLYMIIPATLPPGFAFRVRFGRNRCRSSR